MTIQYRRLDGTFVALVNGLPYHVTQTDPLFSAAQIAGGSAPLQPAPVLPFVPTLADRRASAFQSKRAFLLAVMAESVLTPDDAVFAAQGGWPTSFDAFLAGMNSADRARAKISWAGASEIYYSDPLLQALALSYSGGNQASATILLDRLFGLS